MIKTQLTVTRLVRTNGKGSDQGTGAVARQAPTARLFNEGLGGVGGRVVTHLKALDALDQQTSGYLWKDSDRGDHFETTLPGGVRVALTDSEVCHFGVENARAELENYPQLARRYRRLLRGIPVALTYGHGAGQWRPIGSLDYEMDIATIHAPTVRALDAFYPTLPGKRMTMQQILAEREAEARRQQPLLVVQVSSAVGGLGSSIFIPNAYYLRHLLEKRGAAEVTLWGVLIGPRAFHGRGPNIAHNFAALMRELDLVYREGFHHTFVNGETVTCARPPFDLLFQVDLTEWPEGEDPSTKLSDTAMDAFLRQVALGTHLLTTPAVRDRLQSLLVNAQNREDRNTGNRLDLLASFNAALAAVNLSALDETLALGQAEEAVRALMDKCDEA
jgi:hypothetical protein